ncbi:MAG TPA: excinuclease ABC subunit UvrC [Frankiaceae bacterium]|nr:excinuclease ABC subunit UvrC [Frankiaceae bacterium]
MGTGPERLTPVGDWRPPPGSIPEAPGVYKFRDSGGRVIYVGKAKSLRSRLNSYFTGDLHPRTAQMVATARGVEWTVVTTEVEALQLEYTWIKEFDPRFNVKYRDDKSYPWLAVTISDEYPRLQVMRGAKRKGVRYFGPYAHAWAIRETLDLLLRVFPARTCSNGVFKRAGQVGRPCLLGYIDKCSAPCVDRVSAEQHREIVEDFCDFLSGSTTKFLRRLEQDMRTAAAEQEYERAARLRDDIGALRRAIEKQAVVLPDGTDTDVVAFADDELEAAVAVFHVRGGRVRGQRGYVVDKLEGESLPDLVESFLSQAYLVDGYDVPREVLVPEMPADGGVVTELLGLQRGSRVDLRVPQRGDKRSLLETVERNAKQTLALHRTKRASDLSARSRALSELQDALDLPEAPLRIECYDVSNLATTNVVSSMVVFEDGLPRKSEYRRFAIRGAARSDDQEQNDVASISETIRRRFTRYLDERSAVGEQADTAAPSDDGPDVGGPEVEVRELTGPAAPPPDRPAKFAYPPNLVVVDGGQPQVEAAAAVFEDLGITDIALCGLAKRLEEVWLPGEPEPVILPRTSEALYLLQRVRDEAHRFAITYHRQKRSKSMVESALDGIPGLGETRRRTLLRTFGSLKRLRAATEDEIAEVPGIGPRTAAAIVAALAPEGGAAGGTAVGSRSAGNAPAEPAVDPRTGEILAEVPESLSAMATSRRAE